jgi:hypothetical protein
LQSLYSILLYKKHLKKATAISDSSFFSQYYFSPCISINNIL